MPMPTGASAVVYQVNQYDENDGTPELSTVIRFPFSGTPVASLDEAATAAMDAYVASLEAAHPGTPVYASRQYECSQSGDTWPAP